MSVHTRRTIYLHPTGDGDKVDWTVFGAATDWQAVSKGIQPNGGTPSNTSGIRSSTDGQLERFTFGQPSLNAGEFVNGYRIWIYLEGAIPANQSVGLSPGDKTWPAGTSGWKSGNWRGPSDAFGSFAPLTSCQLGLGESAAQAADTTVTAVVLEVVVSTMETLKVSGRNLVGASTGRVFSGPAAQYGSVAFDNWLVDSTDDAVRYHFRQQYERGCRLVRVFIPFGAMMTNETTVDEAKWLLVERSMAIATEEGMRVIVTGLVTFDPQGAAFVPAWLDALSEASRWATFQRWWQRCALACCTHPSAVIFDYVNEPMTKDTGAGIWYSQPTLWAYGTYLCKSLAGRTEAQVAQQFADAMRNNTLGIDKHAAHIPGAFGNFVQSAAWVTPGQVALPHCYPVSWGVPALIDNVLKPVFEAPGKPVVIEEIGAHTDAPSGVSGYDEILCVLRHGRQSGYVAGGSNWINAFLEAGFDGPNYQHWQRGSYIFGRRVVEEDRINGVMAIAPRIAQRFR